MIGQDADSRGFERPTFLGNAIDLTQAVNLLNEQMARSMGENDRKKERAAADLRASVLWHDTLSISRMTGSWDGQSQACLPFQTRYAEGWWARRKSAFAHPTKSSPHRPHRR